MLDSSVCSTRKRCPETSSPLIEGETSKPSRKWKRESSTAEPQQQTFFQKAHAKRLQKQYEQEQTTQPCTDKIFECLPTDSTNNSAFIDATHKAAVKREEAQTCTWIRHPDTEQTAAKADLSLSTSNTVSNATQRKTQSAGTLQCFTCPVCFNVIETKNLLSFNQHIDKCLSGELGNKSASIDKYQGEEENVLGMQDEAKKDHIPSKVTDLSSGSRTSVLNRNSEGPYSSSSTPLFGNRTHSDFRTPFFNRFQSASEKRSLMRHEAMSDPGSVAFHQTDSSVEVISDPLDSKVFTLTCPVCNQAQRTDDLILFNHHVDMCLNQEVLLEFKDTVPSTAQSGSKVKGQCLRCILYNTE